MRMWKKLNNGVYLSDGGKADGEQWIRREYVLNVWGHGNRDYIRINLRRGAYEHNNLTSICSSKRFNLILPTSRLKGQRSFEGGVTWKSNHYYFSDAN